MTAINELGSIGKLRNPSHKDDKAAAGFLSLWGLGLLVITIGPMLASLYLSFTKFNLLQPPVWIGIDNYTRMFSDPRLLNSLAVTFGYVFVSVPLQLALALALAMLLDKGIRGLSFYRSVYYLPSLLGSSVAIAILWKRLFGANGLFNQFKDLRTEQYRAIYDQPIYPKNQYLDAAPTEGWLAREDATRARNIQTLVERGVLTPPTGWSGNGNGARTPITDTAEKVGPGPDQGSVERGSM